MADDVKVLHFWFPGSYKALPRVILDLEGMLWQKRICVLINILRT